MLALSNLYIRNASILRETVTVVIAECLKLGFEYNQLYLLIACPNQGKAEVFYKLLERAEKESKRISFIEPDPRNLYDDYPVEDLILIVREVK